MPFATWGYGKFTMMETWLKHGQQCKLNIHGYNILRRDREGEKKGGLPDVIKVITVIKRDHILDCSNIESISLELRNRT